MTHCNVHKCTFTDTVVNTQNKLPDLVALASNVIVSAFKNSLDKFCHEQNFIYYYREKLK